MTVEATPKYSTVAELFQDIFKDKTVDHCSVSRFLLTGNVTLLVETICLLLDRQEHPENTPIGGTYSEESILSNILGVNKGYCHPSAEFNGLYYQLLTSVWFDVIDLFRILRSRTDWTAASFRTAIEASEFRAYKEEFIQTFTHVHPSNYRFYWLAKIFELTFSHKTNPDGTTTGDFIQYWIQPVASLMPNGQYNWRFDTFGYNSSKSQEMINYFHSELLLASFHTGNFIPIQILIEQQINIDYTAPLEQKPVYPTSIVPVETQLANGGDFKLTKILQKQLLSSRFILSYLQSVDNREQSRYYEQLVENIQLETALKVIVLDESLHAKRVKLQQVSQLASEQYALDETDWNSLVTKLSTCITHQEALLVEHKDKLPQIAALRLNDQQQQQDKEKDEVVVDEQLVALRQIVQQLDSSQAAIESIEQQLQQIETTQGFVFDEYTTLRQQIADEIVSLHQLMHSAQDDISYYSQLVVSHQLSADLYYEFLRTWFKTFHLDCSFAQDIVTLQIVAVATNDLALSLILAQEGVSFKNCELSPSSIESFLEQPKSEPMLTFDNIHFDFSYRLHQKPLIHSMAYLSTVPEAIRTFSAAQNIDFAVGQLLTNNLTTIVDAIVKYVNLHHLIAPKPPAPPKASVEEKKKGGAAKKGGSTGGSKKPNMLQKVAEAAKQQAQPKKVDMLDASSLFGDGDFDIVVADQPEVVADDGDAAVTAAPAAVSTRKFANLNDISTGQNYISLVCGHINTRVSTLRYLLQKKAKLFTNSKSSPQNNAFLSCLTTQADPQSRDDMIVLLFDHINDGKFMPLLTQPEVHQCINMQWEFMHRPVGTSTVRVSALPSTNINRHHLYYINRSELFFHMQHLSASTRGQNNADPMFKMMHQSPAFMDHIFKMLNLDAIPTLYDISVLNERNAGHVLTAAEREQFPHLVDSWNGFFDHFDSWNQAKKNTTAQDTSSPIIPPSENSSWLYGYYRDVCSLFTGVLFADPAKQALFAKPNAHFDPIFQFLATIRCQPMIRWVIERGFRPTRRNIGHVLAAHSFGSILQDANFDAFITENTSYESLAAGFNTAVEWKKNMPVDVELVPESPVAEPVAAITLIDDIDEAVADTAASPVTEETTSANPDASSDMFSDLFGTDVEQPSVVSDKKPKADAKKSTKSTRKDDTPAAPAPTIYTDLPLLPVIPSRADFEALSTPFSLVPESAFFQTLKKSTDHIFTSPIPTEGGHAGITIGWVGNQVTVSFLFTTDCNFYFSSGHIDAANAILEYCHSVTQEEAQAAHPDIIDLILTIKGAARAKNVVGSAVDYDIKYLFRNPESAGVSSKSIAPQYGQVIDDVEELESIFIQEYFRLLRVYTAHFYAQRSALFSPTIYCLLTVLDAIPQDFETVIVRDFASNSLTFLNATMVHGLFISRPDPLFQIETARSASLLMFMASTAINYYDVHTQHNINVEFFKHFDRNPDVLHYQATSVLARNIADTKEVVPIRHIQWFTSWFGLMGEFCPTALPAILRLIDAGSVRGSLITEFLDITKLYRQMNNNTLLFTSTLKQPDGTDVDISTANQPISWLAFIVSLPKQQSDFLEGLFAEKEAEFTKRAVTVTSEKQMNALQAEFDPIMRGLQQALQEASMKFWEPRHLRAISALAEVDDILNISDDYFYPWKNSDVPHYKATDETPAAKAKTKKTKAAAPFPGAAPAGPAPAAPIVPDNDLLLKNVTSRVGNKSEKGWFGSIAAVSGLVAVAGAAAYAWNYWYNSSSSSSDASQDAPESSQTSSSDADAGFSMFKI